MRVKTRTNRGWGQSLIRCQFFLRNCNKFAGNREIFSQLSYENGPLSPAESEFCLQLVMLWEGAIVVTTGMVSGFKAIGPRVGFAKNKK